MSSIASGLIAYSSITEKYFMYSPEEIIFWGMSDCSALLKSLYFSVRMRLGRPLP